VAETLVASLRVSVQEPDPAHAPLQFKNCHPVSGTALKETTVPTLYIAEHFTPQPMTLSLLAMAPFPNVVTLNLAVMSGPEKQAVTSASLSNWTSVESISDH
jgi:hypothetical protein